MHHRKINLILSILLMLFAFGLVALTTIHMTGRAVPFGTVEQTFETITPEIDFAYQAPVVWSWREKLAAKHIYITEDNARIGPGEQQHATIRAVGGGRYSVWKGYIYFSATDNSDPRSNGRTYAIVKPKPISPILYLLIVGGAFASLALLKRSFSNREILDFLNSKGFGSTFLLATIVLVACIIFAPWDFLFATQKPTDGYGVPLALTAAVSISFFWVRSEDLHSSLTAVFRACAVMFFVCCAFRYYPVDPTLGTALDQFLIGPNRYIGAVAAIIAWWRPALGLYAAGSSIWARSSYEHIVGLPQAMVDEEPVTDMFGLMIIALVIVALLVRMTGERFVQPKKAHIFIFAAGLGLHLSNYYHSALMKLSLEGPTGAWITDNPTNALLSVATELGTAPFNAVPWLQELFYDGMGSFQILSNAVTLASQLVSIIAIFFTPFLMIIIGFYDVWHIVVAGTTGIFFWKWVILNIGFVVALRKIKGDYSISGKIIAASLCVLAPHFFSIFPAGWYDTYELNKLEVFAVVDDTEIRVPPAFFRHYSYGKVAHILETNEAEKNYYPTGTYAANFSRDWTLQSYDCGGDVKAQSIAPILKPQTTDLLKMHHRHALKQSNSKTHHPSKLKYAFYPYHITTDLTDFDAFWTLDLSAVQGYRFRISAICLARKDLGDPVKTLASSEIYVPLQQE